MKRMILSFAALLAPLSSVGPAAAQQPGATAAPVAALTRTQVDALLARPSEVLVIDVRRPDEIATKGGLPVYLSVQLADLERSLAYIPRDRSIITVSNHAARAVKAAALLTANGFKVAGPVGIEAYLAERGQPPQ